MEVRNFIRKEIEILLHDSFILTGIFIALDSLVTNFLASFWILIFLATMSMALIGEGSGGDISVPALFAIFIISYYILIIWISYKMVIGVENASLKLYSYQ